MKKFKAVLQNIQETGEYGEGGSVINGFSDPVQRTGVNDKGIFYGAKNPEQLAKLNAFVNSFLGGSYIDPKEPLKELASRLSHIGYVLKIDNNTQLVAGQNSFPVQIFGEKFGVTATTDLSKGFDHGEDYPTMTLTFNLTQTKNGFVFVDAQLSSAATTDQPSDVGSEIDNTRPTAQPTAVPQQEGYNINTMESFLLENETANAKILFPIESSLIRAKKNGTFTKEEALHRFEYAISAGLRSLNENKEVAVTLSNRETSTLALRLLKNFEKTR